MKYQMPKAGDWSAQLHQRDGRDRDEIHVMGINGETVCSCWQVGEDFDGENQDANMVGNARLIQSAPDLLAACQAALSAPGIWQTDQETGETFGALLEAAIAKARGEA